MGLVLSRRMNETILLIDDRGYVTEVKVVHLGGDRCRLLVNAPQSMEILRGELLARRALAAAELADVAVLGS